MNGNPYQRYKEEAVMTMTSGEMLLLLYDEVLKRLKSAELCLEKEDYGLFSEQIARAKRIVRYLEETLDFNYPISGELYRMYDFFLVELSRIEASRSAEAVRRLRPLVQELREAFAEAAKKVGQ